MSTILCRDGEAKDYWFSGQWGLPLASSCAKGRKCHEHHNKHTLAVLDLFAGCGGMSTGFEMAGLDVVCASDSWDVAAETYRRNHPDTQFVLGDICAKEVKASIAAAFEDRECDILAGGIPCPAYSLAGKRNPNDPRGHLYGDFLEMVSMLEPKMVIIENVVGIRSAVHQREPYWDTGAPWLKTVERGSYEASLLDYVVNEEVARKIIRRLAELGYNADSAILNAADFGVPQARRRVIFIGVRNDLPIAEDFPEPTRGPGLVPWVTVREAIGDLVNLPADKGWSHVFQRHSPEFLERIRNTPVGSGAYPNYGDAWFRLPPDEPGRTVKENHGGVFLHYEKDRVMTPRELARLQSFPDHYLFSGSKGDVLKQLGNAVPPLLAKAVGVCVMDKLESMRESATADNMTGNLRDSQISTSRGETTWN